VARPAALFLLVAEAVRRITLAKGASNLVALARELGLSLRQLERRFHETVGLSPKLFCRIQRFNNVFTAHLIRDCKSLSGNTPAILSAEDADLARHFYRRFGVSHSSNTPSRSSV
jgi:methylphosphotriester-DNA--protein-cysteine methyltransferase